MVLPKVSIIVPVYNTERYLERCISSLKKQTLQDIEIILVDDGSKAECAALCDQFAKEDARIKVFHKQNGGLGFARNSGLDLATGEFVGFVDSDDYIDPAMYRDLYDAASRHNADLAVSGICFVGGNMFGKEDEYIKKNVFNALTIFEGNELKQLLLGVVGALPHEPDDSRYGASVCKNLFRRSMLEEHALRFLSERKILSEDTLFMVDVIKCAKRAVGVPEAYYCYCRNGGSLSKSYNSQRFEKSMVFLKELERRIGDALCEDEYRPYLDRLTQGFGRVLCSQEIMHAREKKIGFSALRKRLNEICTREEIATVLKTYPYHKLPLKQAVFAFTMKHRLFLLQKWIVILRDR